MFQLDHRGEKHKEKKVLHYLECVAQIAIDWNVRLATNNCKPASMGAKETLTQQVCSNT